VIFGAFRLIFAVNCNGSDCVITLMSFQAVYFTCWI